MQMACYVQAFCSVLQRDANIVADKIGQACK